MLSVSKALDSITRSGRNGVIIQEMQIKTTMRFHLTLIKIAKIKNSRYVIEEPAP